MLLRTLLLSTAIIAAGCGEDDPGTGTEGEVVFTSVILTFTPTGGGTAVVAEFDDPDGEGGAAPTTDMISLTAGDYTLAVAFENRLEMPAEDITLEIEDEADEHQIFLTGDAVEGPATTNTGVALVHTYSDTDMGGLPIGLDNAITAAAGTGTLTLTLRHLPPESGTAVKVADLAGMVASGGFGAIGGENDVQIDFAVTVQ